MATARAILSITVTDVLNIPATSEVFLNIDDTGTLSAILAEATNYYGAFDKLTDGLITRAVIEVAIPPASGVKTAPGEDADVTKTYVWNFKQANSKYKFAIDIPAIADAILVNGKVNLANTDVTFWLDLVTIAGSLLTFVSKFYNLLTALLDVFRGTRKHRKQTTKVTLEPGA